MATDLTPMLGAVQREVRLRETGGRPAWEVVVTRTFETRVADVWDAITSAERLPRWFLPVTGDLRQGGPYQLPGNAGGEILVCEPPRHLRLTWESHEGWTGAAMESGMDAEQARQRASRTLAAYTGEGPVAEG